MDCSVTKRGKKKTEYWDLPPGAIAVYYEGKHHRPEQAVRLCNRFFGVGKTEETGKQKTMGNSTGRAKLSLDKRRVHSKSDCWRRTLRTARNNVPLFALMGRPVDTVEGCKCSCIQTVWKAPPQFTNQPQTCQNSSAPADKLHMI